MPVKIKGSEYTTVAERLNAIHEEESSKLTILTEILFEDDIGITMKATVKISGDDPQQFEGHARELYSSNKNEVNFAFALENCETSAIGRALASAGYAGKKFSSAEEMKSIERKTKAREEQLNAKNNPEPSTPSQALSMISTINNHKKSLRGLGMTPSSLTKLYTEEFGKKAFDDLDSTELMKFINILGDNLAKLSAEKNGTEL